MTDKTLAFDWQSEPDGFLKWLLTAMLGMTPNGRDDFKELSDRSKKFTEVELGITLNGIEVNAETFIKRMQYAMDDSVQRGIQEWFQEQQPLQDVQNFMAEVERDVRELVFRRAAEHGVELEERR